ncbi:carcinine hydrolase/isopenicillin-N N-acyltransferase family protein [Geomicrobium sp. JCM 19037]|uniref:carcinine hydrolase/isopenicillin-N N-acyltransferase family protein n=1 Tax=Geomicrobium sp. JCM 19037 TaxID=1460634 RepID=UPI002100CEAF|nr:carcinine hydrolase/isopenicillin-N N-acyltransferase family protein [Geomicrobium sp. JCM 19037]
MDIGKAQGQHKAVQLSSHLLKKQDNFSNAFRTFQRFAPHLIRELEGISSEKGISVEEAFSMYSGYGRFDFPAMGCSTHFTNNGAVRNYDFSPQLYDKRLVCSAPTKAYASVGTSLHLIGRHEGVNEKGLWIFFALCKQNRRSRVFSDNDCSDRT